MDENLGWKLVYAGVIFSLFILGIAYWLISPRESTYFTSGTTQKIAEFKEAKIEGRKEGKKSWQFYAESGWTAKGQDNSHLNNVTHGQIYTNGKLTVNELSAPAVHVSRRAELIEATGPGRTVFLRIDRDLVRANRLVVDVNRKTATIDGEFLIIRRNGRATVGTAEYNAEAKELFAGQGIRLTLREGRIKTNLKANQALLYSDSEKDIPLAGSLEVIQGKKISVADAGVYSRKENRLILRGRTRTIMEKTSALLKPESVKKLNDPDVKNILKGKTVVSAKEMVFSTKSGDARASGSVEVTQKGRTARGDSAAYDDKKELLTLSGNVLMKRNDDWLKCRQVIVSVKKETFEAIGVEEAQFNL